MLISERLIPHAAVFAGRKLLDPQHPLSLLGITDGSIVQLHIREVMSEITMSSIICTVNGVFVCWPTLAAAVVSFVRQGLQLRLLYLSLCTDMSVL